MGILRWLCFCIIAATNWVCAAALAPIPPPTSLLVDQVGVLRDAERAALLARLQTIQTSGRAQIAILISSGTGGAPLADYALQVAETWQLGRAGRDDGLLILIRIYLDQCHFSTQGGRRTKVETLSSMPGLALGVVILSGYFSSGVTNPIGRFFGSGGVISCRIASRMLAMVWS